MTLRIPTILDSPIFWILISVYFLTILITPLIVISRDKKLRKNFSENITKLKSEEFLSKYKAYLKNNISIWKYILNVIFYYIGMLGFPILIFVFDPLSLTLDFFMISFFVLLGFGGLYLMINHQNIVKSNLYQ